MVNYSTKVCGIFYEFDPSAATVLAKKLSYLFYLEGRVPVLPRRAADCGDVQDGGAGAYEAVALLGRLFRCRSVTSAVVSRFLTTRFASPSE